MRDDHGGGNGGCTVFASCAKNSKVATGSFVDSLAFFAEIFDFFRGKTRFKASADNCNGCGNSTVFTDDLFNFKSGFNVLGVRHAVADDGGFKSNNGFAFCNSLCNFCVYVKEFVEVH